MNSKTPADPTSAPRDAAPPSPGRAGEVFEIRDEEIDVREIMARIEQRVEEKRRRGLYRDEPWLHQTIDFASLGTGERNLSDQLAMLKMASRIDLEGEPISSHRPITGQFIVWIKKWSRFWVRRYTDSIFYKQNHFNAEIVNLLTELAGQINELREEVQRLESRASDTPPKKAADADAASPRPPSS